MYKALVVDDEPIILEGFDNLISWEEFGIEISAKAENGKAALQIVREEEIDLLITDIRMPEMSGLELLKTIRQEGKSIKVIILSGYDDFQYVKEASKYGIENYLLKPIEENELEETLLHLTEKLENEQKQQNRLQESYQLLRSNILYRWITGAIGEEELTMRAEFLDISLEKQWYQVCACHSVGELNNEHITYLEQLLGCFWTGEKPVVFITLHGELLFLFSWDGSKENVPDLETCFLKHQSKISAKFQSDVFIAVGSMEEGWQGAVKSYQEAKKLLDYRMIMPANSVVSAPRLKDGLPRSVKHISWNKLDDLISSGEEEKACLFLEKIFSDLSVSATPENIRTLTCEILFYLSKDFSGNSEIFSEESLREILYTVDMQVLLVRLKKCVEQVIRWRNSIHAEENPVVMAVMDYVHKHYHEELSLKILAQKYKVNAAYLGQLFKHEIGELFSAYLCRIRIENAKLLLRETSMKTNEISERTGFANTNYFSNTFKK